MNYFFTHAKKYLLKDGMMKGIYLCVVKHLVSFKENIQPMPLASRCNLWIPQIGVSCLEALTHTE